jgi:hypothetical protein
MEGEIVFFLEIHAALSTYLLEFMPMSIRHASFSMQMCSAGEHFSTALLHRSMHKLK